MDSLDYYSESWDKFEETKLLSKEAFYGNLNMSDISKDDNEHSQKVWKEFGLKNLGEYHDLYLKTDVLLLIYRIIKCAGTARATSSIIKSGQKNTEASIPLLFSNEVISRDGTFLLNKVLLARGFRKSEKFKVGVVCLKIHKLS